MVGDLLPRLWEPLHTQTPPSPASLPAQAWPDGGSWEMQPSHTLVYFERPPVSFPAWGHVVAMGLC